MPVEYKHGRAKASDADRLQLCAQAMALEEMLVCSIPEGALFYEETRRREVVPLTEELRQATQKMADEMHAYFARGYTPKSKPGIHCSACSLKELCLPVLYQRADPKAYLRAHLDEMQEAAQYAVLKAELTALIDPALDSLRFYQLGNNYKSKVEHIGVHPPFEQDGLLLF